MIEYILIFTFGMIVGWKVADFINTTVLKGLLDDLGVGEKELRELARKKGMELPDEEPHTDGLEIVPVKIEQHQGQLYAFREDTDQFLGQGTDRESLIAHISTRLTDVKLVITQDNGADLLQKSHS